MKKIVWIDVGTHYAQEYESAFGPSYKFLWQVFRRFIASKFFFKGSFYKISDIKSILRSKIFFRKNKHNFKFFFVEANSKIVSRKAIYKEAHAVFNFALTSNDDEPIKLSKLFLADSNSLSQGSSIFLEKANVKKDFFTLCLGINPISFFSSLKAYLDNDLKDYLVMLRLNCEGVEDQVIYSAHQIFGDSLKLISGSLKDVKGVKGEEAYLNMKRYMKQNNLPFIFFSSNISTWRNAHSAIKKLRL
tara:strand:- start:218 stop:955 length:738 start_codon:yes stop_codon:yes gene_type:complete